MKIEQIKSPPIEPHLPPEVQYLRGHAPEFIKALVEKSYLFIQLRSLDAFDEGAFETLKAGTRSAVYFVKRGQKMKEFLVIKFRYQGVMAEYESLQRWRRHGVNTIDVLSAGTVPVARSTKHRVKYLISRGVTNGRGEPAETGIDYAARHPESVVSLGVCMGEQLAKLHRTKSQRSFGEFGDMWDNPGRIASWPKYLLGHIKGNQEVLDDIGITPREIARLKTIIRRTDYPLEGTYIHGDFSLRNILIERVKPLTIRVFDPNPLIGHPSWDVAILFNNHEFEKRKALLSPNNQSYAKTYQRERDCMNGLITGYEQTSRKKLNLRYIHQAQLVQMIFLLAIKRHKLRFGAEEPIEVTVREQALREMIWRVLEGE